MFDGLAVTESMVCRLRPEMPQTAEMGSCSTSGSDVRLVLGSMDDLL